MIDPSELLEIFGQETNERLDRIEATLLAIEAGAAGDGAMIGSLFRDAHSIKGNAGMLGFARAQRAAHAMEDVLETARRSGVLERELAGPLLEAADAIRRAIADPPALVHAVEETSGAPAESFARSMRVPAEKLDRLVDVAGEAILHRRRLDHLVGDAALADPALEEELAAGDLLLDDLQDAVIAMRTQPLESITGRYPRAVRDLGAAEGKRVRLELAGIDTQLDRLILDGISETIVHLLRNAIVHGVETPEERIAAGKPPEACVELRAEAREGLVAVSVCDDGRGVSPELLERARSRGSLAEVLAEAGVSTAARVTDLAGRGVGLDAVKRHVESLGGSLAAESRPGQGSQVTLHLPFSLALMRLLLLERGGHVFAVPLAAVTGVVRVDGGISPGGRRSIRAHGGSVTLLDLAEVLGATAGAPPARPPALLVSSSGRQVAVACDVVLGERESVVKALGPLLGGTPGYVGAAILPDGRIALVLDPAFLCRLPTRARPAPAAPAAAARPAPRVLVVDDELVVRELQRSILEAAGYRVSTAGHGGEALAVLAAQSDVELVVTDIEMPQMDGLALLGAIRARAHGGSLPVVIFSSHDGEDDRRRGAQAGADAYIGKSDFDEKSLLDAVARLVETP